jgi:hypothetical protein
MENSRLGRGMGRQLLVEPLTAGRIARFALTAWLLALVGIGASIAAHAGGHEYVELPPALHLLRDGSLAVPLAAVALAAGAWLAGRLPGSRVPDSLSGRLAWAGLTALVFALLSMPGNQAHAFLFGGEEAAGTSLLVDLVLDAMVVLQASLVLLAPLALTPLAPWPPAEPDDSDARGALSAGAGGPPLPAVPGAGAAGSQP